MTSMSPPRNHPRPPQRPRQPRLRLNSWNLLLLVPLLALFTPLFNRVTPKLFGMPFFYWFQILNIFVGVALTSLVYMTTREDDDFGGGARLGRVDRLDRFDVDRRDEGAGR